MGDIILFPQAVISNRVTRLTTNHIIPEEITEETPSVGDHTSEPIKSSEDICRISEYLISQKRYRDNMLFIVGINFGLRVSDLLQLRFSSIINTDLSFKKTFPILEKKTANTRKHKRNRYITLNEAVMDAVVLYLSNTGEVKLNDYMFRCEGNRAKNSDKPLHRNSVEVIIKGVVEELGIDIKASTHTLRKTFAYHQMLMSKNDPRKLLLLQKMFGHSTPEQTLDYIGITREEIEEAYTELNLGKRKVSALVDSIVSA